MAVTNRNPVADAQTRRISGFTLVELVVVTAIIGVLAAIMVPALMKAIDAARDAQAVETTSADSAPPVRAQPPQDYTHENTRINQLDMNVALQAEYQSQGMGVVTRYIAECTMDIELQPADPTSEDWAALVIPFPEGYTEIRDARLTIFHPGDETPSESKDTRLHPSGIYWKGAIPESPVKASASFTALGRERFQFPLPEAQQLRQIDIAMTLDKEGAWSVPEGALQPTSRAGNVLTWSYDSILTTLPLVIEIPGAQSPMGRVTLLFRLVGVAVFLFGLGFWYLSELQQPGQLRDFRWGHFLLLALNFCLYFVLFGVLAHNELLGMAGLIVVSAILSLPLLVLHVTRITNLHFALSRVLPLAVVALGFVTVGVYGGALRDYLLLGGVMALLAFLTLTYQRFLRGMNAYREERAEASKKGLAALRATYQDEVAPALHALVDADQLAARMVIGTPPDSLQHHRLDDLRQQAAVLVERDKALRERLARFDTLHTHGESRVELERMAETMQEIKTLLSDRARDLHDAAVGPRKAQGDAEHQIGDAHCPACGAAGPGLPFCPQCGQAQPVTLTCSGCNGTTTLPVHLLKETPGQASFHCTQCGQPMPTPRPPETSAPATD